MLGYNNRYHKYPVSNLHIVTNKHNTTYSTKEKEQEAGAGLAMFTGIGILGMSIGSAIGTYVFFGGVTLLGMIALIESNPHIKRVASKNTRLIDVIIFGGSIWALISAGITVAAGLTFGGLGYTLVYSRYLRSTNLQLTTK